MGVDIFSVGTYVLTTLLILHKRDSLSDYNIDLGALIILVISPIANLFGQLMLKKNGFLGTVQLGLWIQIAISILLLAVLLFHCPKVQKRSIKEMSLWLLISVVVGIGAAILVGQIGRLQVGNGGRIPNHPTISVVVSLFFVQLGNAAIIEEPLFRGFLWGFLKGAHWKDHWIWLFQAALFWLGHIYYLGVLNYSFWIIVPVCALILGLLVWRSKSIGTSMIAHGLMNSVGDVVSHFTW